MVVMPRTGYNVWREGKRGIPYNIHRDDLFKFLEGAPICDIYARKKLYRHAYGEKNHPSACVSEQLRPACMFSSF